MNRAAALALALALGAPAAARGELVPVRHTEGLAHGFVALRTLEGETLAEGDLTQHVRGDRVTGKLRFRFRDGSLREETTVFTQRGHFRFVSNHVVQKGPAFKQQLESHIERGGRVKVRYSEDGGEEKTIDEHVDLPPDVANGMMIVLLKNIAAPKRKVTVSMVAITPKPRVVKLEFEPVGEDPFSIVGVSRKAVHFVMKVHVPGVTGVVASVLGKVPPDSHFWVLAGDAPTFVRGDTQLAMGGPVWRVELASPTWPEPSKGEGEVKDEAKPDAGAPDEKR
ncbi:MAG: hypothetical protein ACJ79E_06165 [Anaeromyxobacteraceae bacterium]